jgi:exopolysaccharide production protein ExoZ
LTDSVSESGPRSLLHGLQAVRGIFVMLVVCHHVGIHSQRYWEHNWLGGIFSQSLFRVDFFFVLSGLVLWAAHRADAGTPGAWKAFLVKRLFRLYPLLVTLTLVKGLVLGLVPGRSVESFHLLSSLLALPQTLLPIITAAWTLSFEVCYILVLSACLALPRRLTLPALVSWGVLLSCAGVFFGVRPALQGLGFLTHPFVLEFVSGVLMAEWLHRQVGLDPARNRRQSMLMCSISVVALAIVVTRYPWFASHVLILRKLFWAVAFALGLGGLVLWERAVPAKNWRLKDVLGVGRASYSLYLSHGFVLMAFFKAWPGALSFNPAGKDALLALLVILSVLFGLAVWKWVERPLTRWLSPSKRPATGLRGTAT